MSDRITAEDAARSIISEATSSAAKKYNISTQKTAEEIYLNEPTHRNAAEILCNIWRGHVIFERETGIYYERMPSGVYDTIDDILTRASRIIDAATIRAFNRASEDAHAQILQQMYKKAGDARKRAQTKDFIQSTLSFFAESVRVQDLPSLWNTTPECMPTQTGILDFSGDEITTRKPEEYEFFKDPLPVEAGWIINATFPVAFLLALHDIFPNPEIRRTGIEAISQAIANRGTRTFLVFHGEAGANGKNTLLDILRITLPGRVGMISASSITRGQDGGAKRFAAAELEGKTFAAVDEVTGAFDIAEVKRLTGGSTIAIERKGQNPYEIPQTWTLAALTNRLPTFQPATDSAFLQRLIIVPFETVFYFDPIQKDEYLRLGVEEHRLKAASEKEALLKQIELERPAIIRYLVQAYQAVRRAGGRPYECGISLQLKQAYQSQNDIIAQFFLEHFQRNPAGRVDYSRLMDLWKEFSGDKAASTRDTTKRLLERFPWLSKGVSNSKRFIGGMEEIYSDSNSPSTQKHYDSTENGFFSLKEEKQQKSSFKINYPLFRTPVLEIDGSETETASRLYDCILSQTEIQRTNLQKAGLSGSTARLAIETLKLAAGKAGILGERFQAAFDSLQEGGLIRFEDPYIVLTREHEETTERAEGGTRWATALPRSLNPSPLSFARSD